MKSALPRAVWQPSNTPSISSKDYVEIGHLWEHPQWPALQNSLLQKHGEVSEHCYNVRGWFSKFYILPQSMMG